MKKLLTISGILFTIVCFGQVDSLQSRIYGDFINADIKAHDSLFNKKTELVFVTSIDIFEPTVDATYLQDFLDNNIENNDVYKELFNGQDPAAYFDMPPTFGLGERLKEDKELGRLLIKLFHDNKINASDLTDLKTNFKTKMIKDPKPYFKMGWDKFHKKNKNCYGIVRLSKIVFNDNFNRAVFYAEKYKGGLDASGDIITMRKINNTWIVELCINQWMS